MTPRRLWRYLAYGLCLASNRPIPGLVEAPASRDTDLKVLFGGVVPRSEGSPTGSRPWYLSDYGDEQGRPGLIIWRSAEGSRFRLLYSDGAEYRIDLAAGGLWAGAPPGLAIQDLLSYLLGPVIGCLLRLRGLTCLHASAVAIDGRSCLFVGPPHAGKSTTAIALARCGCAVLTDDIAPLVGGGAGILTVPAYPRLRLRQETLAAVARVGSRPPLPSVPDGRRLHLDLREHGYSFQEQALPLGAVYLLGERWTQPPAIVPVSSQDGLIDLLANVYAARLPDKRMRARDFDILGRVATEIPMRRVHADPSRLDALCDALLADMGALGVAA